jgi:cellulose synthase/poly-beta-1,6-N-acetylglucosamine synthase-like glycosyltransferase
MHLPHAPNDQEKYLYVTNQKKTKFMFYFLASFSALFVLYGSFLFSVSSHATLWYFAYVTAVFLYLMVSYAVGVFAKVFDLENHEYLKRTLQAKQEKPTLDIFLPSAGEPLEILENTYKHVQKINWDKKVVYVLDDSAREEVRSLAEKYGFMYATRPNRGELKKAGNIRYGFSISSGEFIAIFDADFCPRQDFAEELLAHLVENEHMAIVQSAQFFDVEKEMGWVERGAGSVQELFYRLIQVNRNNWGGSICVGTNAIYRRKALEPYGGTYPIEHSEDVHTGFNLVKDGWKLAYVPLNLAKGICPDTYDAFFGQQYRWCLGSTSLLLNKELFWKNKLSWMQRISFLSGMFYYQITAASLFLIPIPGLVMAWVFPEHVFWYNNLFSVPSLLFATVFMRLWSRRPHGFYTLKARIVSYYAHLFALADKLKGSTMGWVPTGAVKKSYHKALQSRRLLLSWNILILSAGIAACVANMGKISNYHFYPFLFFLFGNFALHVSCLWVPKK